MNRIKYNNIITVEPGKLGGKACIRGHRFAVQHVFEYLASGMTEEELIAEFDFLTHDDFLACYAWAADVEKQIVYVTPQLTGAEMTLREHPSQAASAKSSTKTTAGKANGAKGGRPLRSKQGA